MVNEFDNNRFFSRLFFFLFFLFFFFCFVYFGPPLPLPTLHSTSSLKTALALFVYCADNKPRLKGVDASIFRLIFGSGTRMKGVSQPNSPQHSAREGPQLSEIDELSELRESRTSGQLALLAASSRDGRTSAAVPPLFENIDPKTSATRGTAPAKATTTNNKKSQE